MIEPVSEHRLIRQLTCYRQHSETVRRCEHTMKDLEYYRGQHHAAMTQLEATAQETSTLRAKYGDIAADKQRLERDLAEMTRVHQVSFYPIECLEYLFTYTNVSIVAKFSNQNDLN